MFFDSYCAVATGDGRGSINWRRSKCCKHTAIKSQKTHEYNDTNCELIYSGQFAILAQRKFLCIRYVAMSWPYLEGVVD